MPGKYNSERDSILHSLCLADWANESFGDVSTYGLFVWRIELETQDVARTNGEFNSIMESLGFESWFPSQLVGKFVVCEDERGFVTVIESEDAQSLFNTLRDEYDAWEDANDDSEPFDVHDLTSNEYHGDSYE